MIHSLLTNNMNLQSQHLLMEEYLSTPLFSNSSHEANSSNSSLNPSTGEPSSAEFPPPPPPPPPPRAPKRKRSLPGHPDPDAEVIALSPNSLLATNRFTCEICNKGFQRDQNLQLHRRGHNLPWKLKQRARDEVVRKKVYVCPERGCVHHDAARALGDLTGIKKHFYRKHGEKKWKCEKCSKKYAVQSDWKAHAKTCGTKEYKCDCGTLFSRRDSFISHRAFCDALTDENARTITSNPFLPAPEEEQEEEEEALPPQPQPQHNQSPAATSSPAANHNIIMPEQPPISNFLPWLHQQTLPASSSSSSPAFLFSHDEEQLIHIQPPHHPNPSHVISAPTTYPPAQPHMSATALLQKAAQLGAIMRNNKTTPMKNQPPPMNNNNNNNFLGFFAQGLSTGGPGNLIGGGSGGSGGSGGGGSSSSSHLLHDILMMKSIPNSFDGVMNAIVNGGMNNDGLTRDFLGPSPLINPSNDIANLHMAGYGDANAAVAASQEDEKAW